MARRRVQIGINDFINLDANLDSCSRCSSRDPFAGWCFKFHKPIQRIPQRNRGFHNNRCIECINAEIKYDEFQNDEKKQSERYYSFQNEKKLETKIYGWDDIYK